LHFGVLILNVFIVANYGYAAISVVDDADRMVILAVPAQRIISFFPMLPNYCTPQEPGFIVAWQNANPAAAPEKLQALSVPVFLAGHDSLNLTFRFVFCGCIHRVSFYGVE